MISALAIPELTVSLLGLSLTALEELAQRMSHGSEPLKTLMMLTLSSNVRTKAFVIEKLANVSASVTTKESPVKELHAPTAAAMPAFATHKVSSRPKLDVPIILLGMPIKRSAAFATWVEEVLIAL